MNSSSLSSITISSTGPKENMNLSEGDRNDRSLACGNCGSVVLLERTAQWTEKEADLPLVRQQKKVHTQKEAVRGFWAVRDMFDFENVGFTHSVDGVKYLACADCEFGPIGFVDNNSKLHLVTPERLVSK